jgi:hypothetical protein
LNGRPQPAPLNGKDCNYELGDQIIPDFHVVGGRDSVSTHSMGDRGDVSLDPRARNRSVDALFVGADASQLTNHLRSHRTAFVRQDYRPRSIIPFGVAAGAHQFLRPATNLYVGRARRDRDQ